MEQIFRCPYSSAMTPPPLLKPDGSFDRQRTQLEGLTWLTNNALTFEKEAEANKHARKHKEMGIDKVSCKEVAKYYNAVRDITAKLSNEGGERLSLADTVNDFLLTEHFTITDYFDYKEAEDATYHNAVDSARSLGVDFPSIRRAIQYKDWDALRAMGQRIIEYVNKLSGATTG